MILSGYNNQNKTVLWFEDLTSLANAKVSKANQYTWNEYLNGPEMKTNSRWLGLKSINDVRRAVELYGWPEGVKKARKAIHSFKAPKLPYFKRKRVRAAQGHALDIHRVYAGDLSRAWEASKRERHSKLSMKGSVNVIVDIGSHARITKDKYFWRGAVTCLLSEALIKSGRNVRIIAVDCTKNMGGWDSPPNMEKVIVAVVLKSFQTSLDMQRLFSATSLCGFYRYYFYKANAHLPESIHDFGRVDTFEVDDIDYFLDNMPCLFVSNIWSKQQANNRLQVLADQIEKGE